MLLSTTALLSLAVYTVGNPLSILIDKPLKIAIFIISSLLLALLLVLPLYVNNIPKADNTILIISLTLLIVTGISFIKIIIDFSHQRSLIIGVLLITSLLISSAIIIPQRLSVKPRNIEQELKMSMDLAKHRPRWVPAKLFNASHLKPYLKNTNRAKFISGEGTIETPTWEPRNIVFEIEAKRDAVIKVNQYYYPGWSAFMVNENEVKSLPTKASSNDGLIQFNLPSGKSKVQLILEITGVERIGQIITLLTIFSLIGWLIFSFYSQKNTPIPKETIQQSSQEKDYS